MQLGARCGAGRPTSVRAPRRQVVLSVPARSLRVEHLGRLRCAAGTASGGATEKAEAPAAAEDEPTTSGKSDEYSTEMSARMGASLTYRHEEGMNYNRILPDLIVGSCLQTPDDVDVLAEKENVKVIFCLQEDSDMAYFNLDVAPIVKRCETRGDIKHVRFRIRDFDPYDLRRKLPKAIARLTREHNPSEGTVYIHCTAGMGRAPATALAYMAWIRGMQLDEGYRLLTTTRSCSPKIEAIRSATADLLLGIQPVEVTIGVFRFGDSTKVQVAGLDIGWHQMVDMEWDRTTHRFVLKRMLYPGSYQYKLIYDGYWSASADHPTVKDGDHTNNILHVIAPLDQARNEQLVRYLSKGTVLSKAELEELRAMMCPWQTHDSLGQERQPWE